MKENIIDKMFLYNIFYYVRDIWAFRFFNILFYIIPILQIGTGVLESILIDLNIIMSDAFYTLSAINFGLGSGTILVRLFVGLIMICNYYIKTKKLKE